MMANREETGDGESEGTGCCNGENTVVDGKGKVGERKVSLIKRKGSVNKTTSDCVTDESVDFGELTNGI